MNEIKTVRLIGAGAIGAIFIHHLSRLQGIDFAVIASGERKARLEKNGMVINDVQFDLKVEDPAQGAPADLVIVSVKYPALDSAIADIKNFVGPQTQILSVLNGVDSEERVAAVYGWEHVLLSFIRIGSAREDNRVSFWGGGFFFGEEHNIPGADTERVAAVRALLDRTELNFEVLEDMRRGMWLKYVFNISESMTTAVLDLPGVVFARSETTNLLREAVLDEALAVAQAKHVNVGLADKEAERGKMHLYSTRDIPSALQDLRAGRKTEVDMFLGRLCAMGRELGIPTPKCELMLWQIKILEERNTGLFQ